MKSFWVMVFLGFHGEELVDINPVHDDGSGSLLYRTEEACKDGLMNAFNRQLHINSDRKGALEQLENFTQYAVYPKFSSQPIIRYICMKIDVGAEQ